MVGIAVNVRTTVINRDFAEVKLRNFWKITTSYHDSDIFTVIPNMTSKCYWYGWYRSKYHNPNVVNRKSHKTVVCSNLLHIVLWRSVSAMSVL
jgi:hypothetical protein